MTTASSKKKLDEKHLKILKDLVAHDTNKHCFDCKQRGPTYVNITIGSFVCTNCGGALRKYNHRVKSIVMSNFTTQEMDFLKRRGNEANRQIYFGLNDGNFPNDIDLSDDRHLDDHLRQKYERKRWYVEPNDVMESKAVAMNSKIYDAVEKGGTGSRSNGGNQFARMPNASAGLILPAPNRTSNVSKAIARPTAGSNTATTAVAAPGGHSTEAPHRPPPVTAAAAAAASLNQSDPFFSPHSTTNAASSVGDPFGPPLSPFNASAGSMSDFDKHNGISPAPGQFASASPFTGMPSSHSVPAAAPVMAAMPSRGLMDVTIDKYAALKELDGLFGGGPPSAAASSHHPHPHSHAAAAAAHSGDVWSTAPKEPMSNNGWSSGTTAAGSGSSSSLWGHQPNPSINPFSSGGVHHHHAAAPGSDVNPFARNSIPSNASWNTGMHDPFTVQAPVPSANSSSLSSMQAPFMSAAPPATAAANPFNPFMASTTNNNVRQTFNNTTASTNPFL